MPKLQNVLSCGASLDRSIEAYFDLHPLDGDDDVDAERGVHAFDELKDRSTETFWGAH